jgi:multiple sugar transport system substrate-binding protein
MKILKMCLAAIALLMIAAIPLIANGGQEEGTVENPATVTFMATESGCPAPSIDQFNKDFPTIKLVRVERDYTKWLADAMAGTAADLVQIGFGTDVGYYARRGLLLDITKYIEASEVVREDDIYLPGSAAYKFDGQELGKGAWYGLPFDYNNIGAITYNAQMFKDAGLPMLSTSDPVTYPKMAELAEKLTRKDSSGTVVIWGYDVGANWIKCLASDMATAAEVSLYSNKEKSKMNRSAEANEFWLYWARLIKNNIASNVNNPAPGWAGAAFQADRIAMVQLGYWFGAQLQSVEGYQEKYAWAPTPILKEGAPRVTNNLGATGVSLYSKTKHPNSAFKVFEWRVGGWEQKRRAATGWGIPPLKSLSTLAPTDNEFNRSRYEIMMDDAKYMVPWQASPFIQSTAYEGSWTTYIDDLVLGKIDEQTFLTRYYDKLDELMQLGKEELGL